MDTADLTGKVAVVTGGASGIGAAAVRRLARRNARVVLVDVDGAAGRRLADEVDGLAITVDVADPHAMPSVVARVEAEFDRLDLVLLNAGVTGGQSGVERLDVSRYRRLVGVNVDHVVYGTCAAVPALERHGGGRIVVMAALAGLEAFPADPLYAMTKAAVVGYVRSAGAALADREVVLTALCPGSVDTLLGGAAREDDLALLTPDAVADALETVVAEGLPGQVWVVRSGAPARPA